MKSVASFQIKGRHRLQWAFSFYLGVDLESKGVSSRLGTVLYFIIRKALKF